VRSSQDAPAETTEPFAPTAFKRILVALDDSDPSEAAISVALDLAAATHSELLCCNVIDTGELFNKAATYGYDPTALLEEMHQTAEALVNKKTELAKQRRLTVDSVIAEGQPLDAILEAAAAHHWDPRKARTPASFYRKRRGESGAPQRSTRGRRSRRETACSSITVICRRLTPRLLHGGTPIHWAVTTLA